jgi:hypothetical protein
MLSTIMRYYAAYVLVSNAWKILIKHVFMNITRFRRKYLDISGLTTV